MLNLGFSVGELEGRLAKALGRRCRLTPLDVRCTFPVFRGETPEGETLFVKVGTTEEWRRSVGLLREIGGCGLFARFVTEEPISLGNYAVFVQEWKLSRTVFPEDMNERQRDRFVVACQALSAALQGAKDFTPLADSGMSPERLYADVRQYAERHPLASRCLRALLELPESRRSYGARPLRVVHGDFHAKNFAFSGDEFACVYDFDKLTQGLECGDFVNALMERFSCLGMSSGRRARLKAAAEALLRACPWPQDELTVAANVVRLQFAARRIRKHPDSAWVAFDVWRRDRALREFLECASRSREIV